MIADRREFITEVLRSIEIEQLLHILFSIIFYVEMVEDNTYQLNGKHSLRAKKRTKVITE